MRGGRGEHGGRGTTVLASFPLLRVPSVVDPPPADRRSQFPAPDRSPPSPQQAIDQWAPASWRRSAAVEGAQRLRRARHDRPPVTREGPGSVQERRGGPKTRGKSGSGPRASRSPEPKLIPLPPSTRPQILPMPPKAIIRRLSRFVRNWRLWSFRPACARWRYRCAILALDLPFGELVGGCGG